MDVDDGDADGGRQPRVGKVVDEDGWTTIVTRKKK
jgi:hypothetical protein